MGIFQRVFGEYHIFRIYSRDLAEPIKALPPDPRFREIIQDDVNDPAARRGYGGYQSIGFVAEENGAELAHCWFWYGNRYKERNFWPLAEGEAKLVRIETSPQSRGQGIAPRLIAYATARMADRGYTRLYARIWHSYKPSLKAFRKAGWRPFSIVMSFDFAGNRRKILFGGRPKENT